MPSNLIAPVRKKLAAATAVTAFALATSVVPAAADSGYRSCGSNKTLTTKVYGANNHYHEHNSSSAWNYGYNYRNTYETFGLTSVNWFAFASDDPNDSVTTYCWT